MAQTTIISKRRSARWLLGVYWRLLGSELKTIVEFRIRVILSIVSFVFPLVMMAAWLAVLGGSGTSAGLGKNGIVSYYLAATLIYQLTSAWVVSKWDDDVRTGSLSIKLVKPIGPLHYLLAAQISYKLFSLALLAPIAGVVMAVGIARFSAGVGALSLTASAVILGFVDNFFMNVAFAMLAFWTTRASSLFAVWSGLGQLLSGFVVPLPLMPKPFATISRLLPFWGTLGLPVEILTGNLAPPDVVRGLSLTAGWAAAFAAICLLLWKRGLRMYDAVGG